MYWLFDSQSYLSGIEILLPFRSELSRFAHNRT